jgi:endonuclease/exonuclease/phosphatase family metal-dependent hydrolase
MRILVYNVEHLSGIGKGYYQFFIKFWRYVFPSKEVAKHLGELVKQHNPDVIFLTEVKRGVIGETFSRISKMLNYPHHYFFTKYNRLLSHIPIEKGNGCVVFSRYEINNRKKEYFKEGVFKKAFVKFDILGKTFFFLHLPLGMKTRDIQLHELIKFVDDAQKDVVVLGDFNTFRGRIETKELIQHCGLINANALHKNTYPSWNPEREFDYVLVSNDIPLKNFQILKSDLSDHLPVLVEI